MSLKHTRMMHTRMIEDMKLAGLAPKTQEVYLQAVNALAKHYGKAPELLTEEEVRGYLILVQEKGARGTFKTCHYGIQFFYRNTLGNDWALFKKSFDCRSRSGCRRPFPIPKLSRFSAAFTIRSTMAVSA